ncbi:MAG: hypothetical protein Q4G09_05995 [Clostridia bacterium]|nr:hypothetical protein [Clostridia bacterium]
MNKKEAIAYAQIALNNMLTKSINEKITIQDLSMNMKSAFRLYNRNSALYYAEKLNFSNK